MDYDKIVVQWMEFEIPVVSRREAKASFSLDVDFVNTVSGSRRAGKTFFCFQVMNDLIAKGVPRKNIFYVNFEYEKLIGADASDLDGIYDKFVELYQPVNDQKIYLFLDEIQNVKNWDSWVRRVFDTNKDVKIVLTGSSSKLLSREISTSLRGRVINTEIFPLSFKEMLEWNHVDYDLKTLYSSKKAPAVKRLFSDYLRMGGYPGTVNNDAMREQILQNYFDAMIFRDVVERHDVKEVRKLRVLSNLIFESVASELSYNRLSNKMKSLGFSLSSNTVIDYVSYFEDSYLFFLNQRYDYSVMKQAGSVKKVYCIDNGLLNSVSFKFSDDKGKLLENAVFIELRRAGKDVFYYRRYKECDFVVREKNRVVGAIQVTMELNDDNYGREVGGLFEAMKEFGLSEGIVVTYDQMDEITAEGMRIVVVPAWMWLLGWPA